MKKAQAEEIAVRALIFLAGRTDDLQQFLTASGLDGIQLIQQANDSAILAAVLGFVAGDEQLAQAFSEEEKLKPGQLLHIYAVLDPHGSSAW